MWIYLDSFCCVFDWLYLKSAFSGQKGRSIWYVIETLLVTESVWLSYKRNRSLAVNHNSRRRQMPENFLKRN